jgi:hypothetical protein
MKEKLTLSHYFTFIGVGVGLISLAYNVRQYYENKEMRAMQQELTALQLQKVKRELEASGANTSTKA